MTTLPGVGLGHGSFWTVRGSEVELMTRARCKWGSSDVMDMIDLVLIDDL